MPDDIEDDAPVSRQDKMQTALGGQRGGDRAPVSGMGGVGETSEEASGGEGTLVLQPAHLTPTNNAADDVIAAAPPQASSSGVAGPDATANEDELGRGKRVAKRKDLGYLNVCKCGESVDVNDKSRPTVKCVQRGCETQHVSAIP